MRTCKRCGTEFEGKFCHECGQEWIDSEICPQCGSELKRNAKFCSECGCRIDGEKAVSRRPKKETGAQSFAPLVCKIMRYVPMAIAVLFAVLLPLLYIAPIVEANEMLGATESINVYSLDVDFYGISVAYIVFMCLAVLLAVVTLFLHISKSKRQKNIGLFGNVRIGVGEFIALLAVVSAYLPCLIISAVAMAKAAELNKLLGGGLIDVVYAGAAPKAVLSFAVIFTVFSVCAVVTQVILQRAFPELNPKCDEEPIEVTPCKKPLLYYAYLNAKLRRAATVFFVCSLISAIVLCGCFWGFLSYLNTLMSPHWVIVGCAAVTIVTVIGSMVEKGDDFNPGMFLYVVQKKNWHIECKLGIKKVIFLAIILAAMIITHIATAIATWTVYGRGYIMATVYVGITTIAYVVAKIAIAVQSGYIAEYLFGVPGPAPGSSLQVEFDEERELNAYKAYIAAKKNGVAIADNDFTKKKTLKRRLALSAACCAFAIISIVSPIVSPVLTNKFSASFVSNVVEICQEHYLEMETLFGKPNEKKDLGIEGEWKSEHIYVAMYYDDNYMDLYNQSEKLQKQIEQAQEQMDMDKVLKLNAELEALNNKVSRLVFNSLTVTYRGNTYGEERLISNYDIIQIALNTNTTVGKTSQKKTAKSVALFDEQGRDVYYDVGKGFPNSGMVDGLYAEIFYTDGSYKYELVKTSVFSGIDFSKSGKQTVKWSDEWGTYSATVESK